VEAVAGSEDSCPHRLAAIRAEARSKPRLRSRTEKLSGRPSHRELAYASHIYFKESWTPDNHRHDDFGFEVTEPSEFFECILHSITCPLHSNESKSKPWFPVSATVTVNKRYFLGYVTGGRYYNGRHP
jgi:hypothetical protein